jgi:hypothetical protein
MHAIFLKEFDLLHASTSLSKIQIELLKMSLECLAILGNQNEPLYLCATGNSSEDTAETEDDAFGFLDPAAGYGTESRSPSIRHEVRLSNPVDCRS